MRGRVGEGESGRRGEWEKRRVGEEESGRRGELVREMGRRHERLALSKEENIEKT